MKVLVAMGIVLVSALSVFGVLTVYSQYNIKDSYLACGCGGCGGLEPRIEYVKSRAEFEELVKVEEELDRKMRDPESSRAKLCAVMGCGRCIEYRLVGWR